jgi:hypothetical protein
MTDNPEESYEVLVESSDDDVVSALRLTKAEQRLLDEVAPGRQIMVSVRTGTTVDVGAWFRQRRVVGVWLDDEMVMIAPGRRPYVERVPFKLLGASTYNHLVGELVLAPASGVRVRQLKMSPQEAGRALRWILNVSEEAVK